MLELYLHRSESTLDVMLGEHKSTFPLADVALNATTWERIYDEAVTYGRDLFDKTFRDEQLRTMLANLQANERLLLVADDPLVAVIPWEYLRDQNNKLLASRLNFVRGIPESQRKDNFSFNGPLEIIAVPVSSVDEPRILNVEGEWKNLAEAVTITSPPKSLTLKRVRPPTRSQLERSLSHQCISIVHFMGHSTSRAGKAFLAFEDARARSHLIDAADFADSLNSQVFLVVLNSCLSAVVAPTEFGNIAQALVYRSIPYALGMQFILPDDAALVLSDALYDFLLQGHSVEEAVMHTRRALEEPGKLANPAWLVGIPVLYTSLRTPASPIELTSGQPTIQPDPARLQKTCDLTALPHAPHFLGRSAEISEVLGALLSHRPADFVVLHGLGGIGKTSLARVVAERVSHHYGDRVLAVSFETFATLDANGQTLVEEYFADRFYNQLAHFYELDPAAYNTTAGLQRAILQRRMHLRSMLVLDNIETLIDAQARGDPASIALATFISRLKEGDGAILLTSRILPPTDWGDCKVINVSGLDDDAGGSLLLALLPPDRRAAALPGMHRKLSQRVKGHPLSIRLIAGRFAEATTDLETFLKEIDAELQAAEQATPTSLEDPERQATLYACLDYSVRRLTPEQRKVLDAISLFLAPFPPEFAGILDDEEHAPVQLQTLVRLGLLTATVRTFPEGELLLLELHPMQRWYIQHHLPAPDAKLQERYGEVYEQLAREAYEAYDNNSRLRYLVRQSLPDFETALQYLPPAARSSLAYHLANPYQRLGQNRRALALYEQVLEMRQELGDVHTVAVTQSAMADVLVQQGQPKEALALYEEALHTKQELGDKRGVAVTQQAMAQVLVQLGKPQEALVIYEEALHTMQELGDKRGVAVTQQAMAQVLSDQGQPQEALVIYEEALRMMQELGDVRNVAVTQSAMADVLRHLGKPQEALALYEEALHTMQELGDIRGVAVTQASMADVLVQLGKPQEALAIYEEALHTMQELGDKRGVAVTQTSIADVLVQQGQLQEALVLYEQALRTKQELGDKREVAVTQQAMANVLSEQDQPQEALALYEEALGMMQELGDVRNVAVAQSAMADVLKQLGKPQEALTLYKEALGMMQELADKRGVAVTQASIADVLKQLGKPQEALALYKEALQTFRVLEGVRDIATTQLAIAAVLRQQGQPQEALTLYKQNLSIYQELGDIRSVAVTQSAMADVLRQLGQPREALALYKEALGMMQELADKRGVAVAQTSMANVLVELGQSQEALTLYEQSLRTKQELGDKREVAVTQSSMARVLVRLGQLQEALVLYEQALRTKLELGDKREVAVTQHAIADVLVRLGQPQEALALYEQALRTKLELGDKREVAVTQANFSQLLLQLGEHHRALRMAWEAYTSLHHHGYAPDAQVVQEVLISIKGQVLGPAQFDTVWREAIDIPQPAWLRDVQAEPSPERARISAEQLSVFVTSTITVMTIIPEKRVEWRRAIEQVLQQAQSRNQAHDAEFFTAILAILAGRQPALPDDHPYAGEIRAIQDGIAARGPQEEAQPFDSDLIERSVAALLGSPQQKMEHMQYLAAQLAQATDEGLKALLQVIQLALFSKDDLSQLGRDLQGVYREAWETIAATVEAGGVDARVFEAISNNTLAVLGPAASRRGEWRNNLVEIRNQATAHGDSNMAAMLDAVIALLDTGGNPSGLGNHLKGIYAKTWQAIVERLSK